MKSFIPKFCPECNTPLTIEFGKKEDVIKLICPNKDCCGSILKKLQKGIIALDINGLGPSTIEKLSLSGIESSVDLFDKSKFNEKTLCEKGHFVKGRALEKILQAVEKIKEIPIQKAILSLQIKDIGKTFSEKIGQYISGLNTDFSGLQLDIREQISNQNSDLYQHILNSIKRFEDNGIKIIRYEIKKKVNVEIKKIEKSVATTLDDDSYIKNLGWKIVDVTDNTCNMLIVNDKDENNQVTEYAKENGIKIMSIKQIKLIF